MQRLTRERLEDQEIERALEQIGWFRHGGVVALDA
jgi:hypothetical protein